MANGLLEKRAALYIAVKDKLGLHVDDLERNFNPFVIETYFDNYDKLMDLGLDPGDLAYLMRNTSSGLIAECLVKAATDIVEATDSPRSLLHLAKGAESATDVTIAHGIAKKDAGAIKAAEGKVLELKSILLDKLKNPRQNAAPETTGTEPAAKIPTQVS